MVFKMMTDPNLVPQWWGPKECSTTVDRMDLRPGGSWRFVQRSPDGKEYAFRGIYREMLPPVREVHTFEFEGMPGHVIIETAELEEVDGKTKLIIRDLFQTTEDRDGMFSSGMEKGSTESMDRFEELLKEAIKKRGSSLFTVD